MSRAARLRIAGFLVLLGALVGPVLTTLPAAAHAFTLATAPANGEELDAAPRQVRVTFSEPVTLPAGVGAVVVIDASGALVGDGDARLVDGRRTLVIGVRPGLPKGAYIASWSVVSADSHPVGGSLQFGYGVPATAAAGPAPPEPDPRLDLLVGLAKGLLYLGLVAALGSLPAALVLSTDPAERRALWRVARAGAGLAVLASLAQVVLQYLWDASALPGGPSPADFAAFLSSTYATTVAVRIGLLLLALLLLPPVETPVTGRSRLRWLVEGVLALAILGSVVRNGHGAAGEWWFFASTLLHVAAVVAWLGGLAALGWLVLRGPLSAARVRRLPLWSAYAAASVGLIAATGLVQALAQVRHPAALVQTTYGAVLLVKLTLVGGALLLGLLGHRWVRSLAGQTPGADRLARARSRIRAEAGLGAAVVLVSGVLSSTPPAEVSYAPTRVVDRIIGPYAVRISVSPARRGPQSFRVVATGKDAATPPASALELALDTGDSTAVRALPVSFPYRLPGVLSPGRPTPFTFVSPSVNVPEVGTWTGTLTVVAGPTLQYTDTFRYRVL